MHSEGLIFFVFVYRSKFNTGGGFGGAILNKIDTGTARLSYSRNSRFGGLMNDNNGNAQRDDVALQVCFVESVCYVMFFLLSV